MKQNDKKVLECLRSNARQSLASISNQTGIPLSSVGNSIRRLEKGIIKKYVSLLDFQKIGYALCVHYLLSSSDKSKIRMFLEEHPNVNNASEILKDIEFHVECVFKNFSELHEFRNKLNDTGVSIHQEIFITEELKRETFFTQ